MTLLPRGIKSELKTAKKVPVKLCETPFPTWSVIVAYYRSLLPMLHKSSVVQPFATRCDEWPF